MQSDSAFVHTAETFQSAFILNRTTFPHFIPIGREAYSPRGMNNGDSDSRLMPHLFQFEKKLHFSKSSSHFLFVYFLMSWSKQAVKEPMWLKFVFNL